MVAYVPHADSRIRDVAAVVRVDQRWFWRAASLYIYIYICLFARITEIQSICGYQVAWQCGIMAMPLSGGLVLSWRSLSKLAPRPGLGNQTFTSMQHQWAQNVINSVAIANIPDDSRAQELTLLRYIHLLIWTLADARGLKYHRLWLFAQCSKQAAMTIAARHWHLRMF